MASPASGHIACQQQVCTASGRHKHARDHIFNRRTQSKSASRATLPSPAVSATQILYKPSMPWDLVPVAQDGVGRASHPGARVGARIHQLRLWAARLDVRAVLPPAQAAHAHLAMGGLRYAQQEAGRWSSKRPFMLPICLMRSVPWTREHCASADHFRICAARLDAQCSQCSQLHTRKTSSCMPL